MTSKAGFTEEEWMRLKRAPFIAGMAISLAGFTEEEWMRLKRAPFIAGMAISLADPGGPIEAIKETAAALRTVTGAAESGGRGELVDGVAREVAEEGRQRKNPLSRFKPKGATAGVASGGSADVAAGRAGRRPAGPRVAAP